MKTMSLRAMGLAVFAAALAFAALAGAGTASATVLCKTAKESEKTLICPKGQEVGVDISKEDTLEMVAVTEWVIGSAKGTVRCQEGRMKAAFNSNGTSPEAGGITTAKFTGVGGGLCTSEGLEGAKYEVGYGGLPYSKSTIVYTGVSGPQGQLTMAGPKGVELTLKSSTAGTQCSYKPLKTLTAGFFNPLAEEEWGFLEFKASTNEFELAKGTGLCPAAVATVGGTTKTCIGEQKGEGKEKVCKGVYSDK